VVGCKRLSISLQYSFERNECSSEASTLEHDPKKWKPVFPRDKREADSEISPYSVVKAIGD
jgi:hypothetical protein